MRKLCWVVRAFLLGLFIPGLRGLIYFGPSLFTKGMNKLVVGKKTRIYPQARIEIGQNGHCTLGKEVSIGQSFHLICEKHVTIGDFSLISSNVFISDTDHNFLDINQPYVCQGISVSETNIGNNVFIGRNATILAGSRVGDNCIIAAHAVVKGVFPDNCMIAGTPAKIIKVFDPNLQQWISDSGRQ
ncbi:acyltransferase [Pantoea sp. B65]|uniref:acyltransferase n=1 Tax=Pantoea sp. B65 TaxID=2813359 RepID=UPI0039B4AB0A